MPAHGQDNQPYGHGSAIDWLADLMDNLAQSFPQPRPKPAPRPKPGKPEKK